MTSVPLNALLKSRALHVYRIYLPLAGQHVSFQILLHASHHLVMLPNKYDVIYAVGKCEILWDIQRSMDYVITTTKGVNISLGQDYEWLFLFITFECKLFMILFFS